MERVERMCGIKNPQKIWTPAAWSQTACDIAADKYLAKDEISIFHMVQRVVDWIADRGMIEGYFKNTHDKKGFRNELEHILLHQEAAFNSPVWFNVGVEDKPQCSACFINGIEDTMDSILNLAKIEGSLFKHGSGTGTNFSPLRGSAEKLSGGGTASGPISFMKGFDAFAGVIKSGGKTRRAAKMVILDDDHPDLMEFIQCKMDGRSFQNSNNSVRVKDDFMRGALGGRAWYTFDRVTTEMNKTVSAAGILDAMAKAAWKCGDPGIQFHDTINMQSTVVEEIHASNPCSEYMFVDNSACNLASLNLLRFWNDEDGFDMERFQHVARIMVRAMDILVGNASYPTEEIRQNSLKYRPLGLGFTNLGAYLMECGVAYDSEKARDIAAGLTRHMQMAALLESCKLAQQLGAYPAYTGRHCDVLDRRMGNSTSWPVLRADIKIHGLRNAQLTCIAPTGTISFLMDCESTGIEPVSAPEAVKNLVGGGTIKQKPRCLDRYDEMDPIAATALGKNTVSAEGHLKMMAAVQRYLDGAISKTVNLPKETVWGTIRDIYIMAWKLGLKSVAIYRDGSRDDQPMKLVPVEVEKTHEDLGEFKMFHPTAHRIKLPDTRESITHKFSVGGQEGYFTVGLYDEDSPGELFVVMSKEGSTISGLLDAWAMGISLSLQYGVPLKSLVNKIQGARFSPSGPTTNPEIPVATSVVDYICRWLERRFLQANEVLEDTGEYCPDCEVELQRSGTCLVCPSCGTTTGCG